MEIAVYGKGGIGKSTVSANLSVALSLAGKRVLQIGCDPKHDSVKLLMHGREIKTVLDYLKDTDKRIADPSNILFKGCHDIGCIEAGGPRPGVGCAGRGIISAFEFLDEHHIKEQYDAVVYDVLGDVVCGGFAVPVRREYADVIFLVTSGEFMSVYAANNILRGIYNFDQDKYSRVAGIIYNSRNIDDEDGRIKRFAKAVNLPVCARLPRSDAFAYAEAAKMPLMELDEDIRSDITGIRNQFMSLARLLLSDDSRLYPARPLEDEELEAIVLEGKTAGSGNYGIKTPIIKIDKDVSPETNGSLAKVEDIPDPSPERPPLYGCAFTGAITAAVKLTDAIVIAHGPRACAFYTWQNISSPGRKNLFNRGVLIPSALSPSFESTDMEHAHAVFGGADRLRECVESALESKPPAVIIISSCISGIIGDDILSMESLSTEDTPVIAIEADGVMAGDYMHGISMLMKTVAERLIDPGVASNGRCINIINEASVSYNNQQSFEEVRDILGKMDIDINCRFLGGAVVEEVRGFLKAPVNVRATDGQDSMELAQWLEEKYGCSFLDGSFPIGLDNTIEWIQKLGEIFDCKDRADLLSHQAREKYEKEINNLRPVLTGKKVIITTINTNMDWLLDAAIDCGMEILWIGVLNYLRMDIMVTRHHEGKITIDGDPDWDRLGDIIGEYAPDLVLSNYTANPDDENLIIDRVPMTQVAGFYSAIPLLKRYSKLFMNRRDGDWKKDEGLFEKYFG